jgi:hypothetical protein
VRCEPGIEGSIPSKQILNLEWSVRPGEDVNEMVIFGAADDKPHRIGR